VGIPIAGALVSIGFNAPYLLSILLFYGAPGIYCALRFGHRWQAIKALFFAVVASFPFALVVDYIGTVSGVWYAPHTLFPGRFLDIIPWEDFIWMAVAAYTIIVLYEIFLDRGKREFADRRMWHFVLFSLLGLSAFFLVLASGNQGAFVWGSQYAYLYLGVAFFLLPAALFLWRFPQFLIRFLPVAGYFLYLTALFEITATHLQQWIFTGSYLLPPLNTLGNNPVPYEELFFVGVVGPLAAIALYEFFDDDEK